MATYDPDLHTVVLSETEARAGVTGHHVRYVLAASMAGVIVAFTAVAIYFGFDALRDWLSSLVQSPSHMLHVLAAVAIAALLSAAIISVALATWDTISGPSADESQRLMRFRVATQFALITILFLFFAHFVG